MDVELARELCPTADDVWLWAMELKAGAKIAVVAAGYVDFAAARGSQAVGSLTDVNVRAGANDHQIRAVVERFALWPALNVDQRCS
jgi:hypothetical protein